MPSGYVIYIPLLYFTTTVVGIVWLYIHIGVGSALLVSMSWAMREPPSVRRVTGTGSHAFFILKPNTTIQFG